MTKERKAVTLDPEVAAYLSAEGRNASQTVNKLVRMEMNGGGTDQEILRYRMENQRDQYEIAAQKARRHLERYNQLKRQLEESENRDDKLLNDVREKLSSVPLEEDNPAVQHQADRVDMTPAELIEEVRDDAE